MSRPFLSAALIVRNEERFLDGCLRSLNSLVDEVVVVDTGSSDRTVEIARDLGASVHEMAWKNDFSVARNRSVDIARGDWILYIDADERVVPFDRTALAPILNDPTCVCATVLFRPTTGYTRYREHRLFRKLPLLRFEGNIHESLIPSLERLGQHRFLTIATSTIAIDHLGYDGDIHFKHSRNLPLLRERLKNEPLHIYCWDQLGLTLQNLGDRTAADAAWVQAIGIVRATHKPTLGDSLPYLHLAQSLMKQQKPLVSILDEGCRLFPDNHALTWLAAQVLLDTGYPEEASRKFAQLACAKPDDLDGGPLAYDASIFGAQAHAALGACAYRMGRIAESIGHYKRAQALAPDDVGIRAKHAALQRRDAASIQPRAAT